MGESIWFALTSITPQGGGECPKALSGRVLVAAYWLFIVLMLATFTANLAAFLTVERYVRCRGTSILREVRNVEISRVTQQLRCSKSHDFLAVFALAHSKINQIA